MRAEIDLHFVERGCGKPLVLIPGWSQSAAGFRQQLDGLSDRYRVIAVDLRGHGESPKPPHGYRIARLARDVHEFLRAHALDDVAIAGHSMGAAVIWSYCEQFGRERLGELIFIDQAPVVTNGFGLEGPALAQAGCAFTPEALYATAAAVARDQAATLRSLRGAFFSAHVSDEDAAFNVAESLKLPAAYAARLLVDHASQDWRDVITHVIPALHLPTLVIGGALETIFPVAAMAWIAGQIPHAELAIVAAEDRGSHFMFQEAPEKFDAILRAFLDR